VLTLAVPFIGYRFVAMFRDKACGGFIGFAQACLFLLSMYLFASLLASVAHYIYFAFIDNGFMAAKMTAIINAAMQVSPVSEEDRATLDEALKEFAALTPADFTLQYLSSDIVFCSLLSVPTALLAVRRRRRSKIEMLKEEETE
jgi:ABC-type lipoprotein release transport system permease subunit